MCWVGDVTESEDGEEEHHQLPSHEAVSEDQGTDQAGQVKRIKKLGGGTEAGHVLCVRR